MTSRPVKGAHLYFSLALRIVGVDCPQVLSVREKDLSSYLKLEVRSRAITQHNPTVPSPICLTEYQEPIGHFRVPKAFTKKRNGLFLLIG